MLLATTALLLQFLAVPNLAPPAVTAEATSSAAPEAASTQPEAKSAEVNSESSADSSGLLSAAVEPDPRVTYMPGRLVLEPVMPIVHADPIVLDLPFLGVVLPSAAAAEKELRWEQRQKRIWKALSIAQSGAATFDAWSTRRVISSGQGQELNPMLRPFAGNDSLYVVIQVAPLALDYAGRRMMMSHNSWARRTWWIPQAVGTVVSFAGGVNNLSVH